MHPTSSLQVVVGLGKTGVSCVRYLVAQGENVAINDSRTDPPGLTELRQQFPTIPLSLGKFDADLCSQASQIIVSPGIPLETPAIARAIAKGIPAIGDIELFAQRATAPVVAITGSNGKSTVTTLVGEMAKHAGKRVAVGGNLGTPALDLLTTPEPDLYVLELSSFQLETTYSLAPHAAALLNISEDHMDRYHHSMQAYLAAKQRIYQRCHTAIVNRDDPTTWQSLSLPHRISFGLDAPKTGHYGLRVGSSQSAGGSRTAPTMMAKGIDEQWYLARGNTLLIATRELTIKGRHQQANALAALALGEAAGLPLPAMLDALRNFHGLAHRCQWVATYHGVEWYNDSKATNVSAAQAAIEGLGAEIAGKLIVIAGGIGKQADFAPLRTSMHRYVRTLILIGQDAPQIETALDGSVAIIHAQTLEHAVSLAQHHAYSGDAVILAPACASFDMFKNFEHRGEAFIAAVKALA